MSELLAAWHLQRARSGASDYDRNAVLGLWPGCPLDDLGLVGDWLLTRPDVTEAVARIDPNGPPPDGPPLHLLTADDILTTSWPEPVWAIPSLLPVGLAILAGKPKVGKSWLALQIAQAVASGGMALGKEVERGPVLYLALEDRPQRLQQRMRMQKWPNGLDCEFMVLGEFAEQIGDLKAEGGERLARQIEIRGYRLVVIDTLSRAVSGDQIDVDQMTRALAPIQEMANAKNCVAMLIDHHAKGFGTTPDAVLNILGSTAKGAVPDTIWGMYKESGKSGAKLVTLGRDVDDQTLALEWDPITACWQCKGDAYELEMTERRQEIMAYLSDAGQVTIKEIAEGTGQDRSNAYKRVQDLVKAGKVAKTGRRPVLYEAL